MGMWEQLRLSLIVVEETWPIFFLLDRVTASLFMTLNNNNQPSYKHLRL